MSVPAADRAAARMPPLGHRPATRGARGAGGAALLRDGRSDPRGLVAGGAGGLELRAWRRRTGWWGEAAARGCLLGSGFLVDAAVPRRVGWVKGAAGIA